MCGRYRLKRADKLAERFGVMVEEEIAPRYNIAPSQAVAAIKQTETGRELAMLKWGLVPAWASDPKHGVINARVESILEKPTFRESFERRRCLIPTDGFYEWKRAEKTKQAFHFAMADESVFAFAGIWDRWGYGTSAFESCAILTTPANDLLADMHHRMPVIVRPEDYDTWLKAPAESCGPLLRPYDAAAMRRWPVGDLVNNPANDSPECLAVVEASEPQQQQLFM